MLKQSYFFIGVLLIPNLSKNPSHFSMVLMTYHRVLFDLLRFILIGFQLAFIRKQFDRLESYKNIEESSIEFIGILPIFFGKVNRKCAHDARRSIRHAVKH